MPAAELFETVLIDRTVPRDPCIAQLIWWAARLSELGFTPSYGPGDHGNLSCRTPTGLLVTARHTAKAALRPEQFVDVVDVTQFDGRITVHARGVALPSTDVWLHWRVYDLRPDIHAILHGHDSAALAQAAALHLPVTTTSGKTPSMAIVDDVCKLVAAHNYLLMRDHGFVALGQSIDEAGELVRKVNGLARSL